MADEGRQPGRPDPIIRLLLTGFTADSAAARTTYEHWP